MALTLEQLKFLDSDAGAEALATSLPDDPLAAQKALRKLYTYDQACAVGHMRELRRRPVAAAKFSPELAGQMLFTEELLQQCSSLRMANYVGRRMAEIAEAVGRLEVMDFCSGLGADAIGMAAAGLDVRGYDISPEAVVCATHNVRAAGVGERASFETADVTQLASKITSDAVVHVDPDRRRAGRRAVELSDVRPGEDFLRGLTQSTAAGSMKLSAALDFAELDGWSGVRTEYVSEDGVCKQLIAWWGGAADDQPARKATVLWGSPDDPQSESIPAGPAGPAPHGEIGRWLIEPGPEVIAAHATDDLAARDGLWRIHPGMVWLFADAPVNTHLARSYEILQTLPGREREVRIALKKLDAGLVEVKSRGVSIDTDRLQRRLRGKGGRPLVVLWTRLGDKQRAFIGVRR